MIGISSLPMLPMLDCQRACLFYALNIFKPHVYWSKPSVCSSKIPSRLLGSDPADPIEVKSTAKKAQFWVTYPLVMTNIAMENHYF